VRSFADLMLMDPRSELDRESLQIIRREADRAAGVVSDLRQLARETQADSQQGSVDVNELVRHVVKVRRYALDTSNIELHEELEADLPRVLAVRGDLEQVVLNLVVNAEQAMRKGPGDRRLVLRTRSTPDGVAIDVLDTGVGIPSHHLERIYDPFFTTKDPGEGTGLGLSLVHSIVREHGGEIRVASDPGRGTQFRVELPRGPADAEHARAPEVPRRSTTGGLSVLVVDDEAAIREVTARFLRRRGHRVDTAAEGGEALEKLAAAPYDVLVSDLRMPGIDGEALLQRLRALDPERRPKMVIVTGDIDASRSVAATSHPGVPVLIKPVRLQELAEVVERTGAAVEVFPEP
jgi:two-component system NtrC family sensor kinase